MTYKCKKTKREFENKQGFLNHLRSVYVSNEEAYKQENNINTPTCKYCDNKCKFHGFFIGYYDTCCHIDCVKMKRSESAKNRSRQKKEVTYIIKKCKYCGNTFKLKKDTRDYCGDKKCVSLNKNSWGISDIILTDPIEINNLFQFFKYKISLPLDECINRIKEHLLDCSLIDNIYSFRSLNKDTILWKCPVTSMHVPISKKSNILLLHLQKHNIDVKSYYKEFLPEYISFCKMCGEFVGYSVDLQNPYRNNFCNRKCYWSWMRIDNNAAISDNQKKKQSVTMKKLISEGKFTPNINNVYNGEIVIVDGKKYRSSWEAVFHFLNKHLLYEDLKIKYYSKETCTYRNYITDFVDYDKKIIYEIKPLSMKDSQNVKDKEKYAIKWCNDNGYQYKFISENWFRKNLNESVLDGFPKKYKKKLYNLYN